MRKTIALLIASLFVAPAWAAVKAAAVVSIQGKAEVRPVGSFEWKSIKSKQDLESGDFVRTGESSQMGVLFSNKMQIRLTQNSQMQIKSLGEPATEQAAVQLSAGRAWSQIKPQTSGRPAGYARVSMETPSATMSIRGTDWEVEVDPDGRTQLVVLSGNVEMANQHGSVEVGRNEAAIAEVGKAPVKIVLTNPQARVQWVTAYRPEPWRYLLSAGGPAVAPTAQALRSGDYAGAEAAAAKLDSSSVDGRRARAAVMIARGQFAEARALLDPAPADWMGSLMLADLRVLAGRPDAAQELSKSAIAAAPDAAAAGVARGHLARLLLIADRETEIPALLAPSLQADGSVDAWVAEGTRARFAGEAPRAQAAYGEAARIAPQDERGWLGLGTVANEKEDVRPARELLNKAATLNPLEPASHAELGTLESFANRFDAAQAAFTRALELQPDDYVALTGQGIMKLKQGKTEEALDDFLRAGVMEPRYARARLYTGITYYQMGEVGRALEEFARAAELDPKDPLPHLYASMVATDTFDAAQAVASAREALDRMPNLKSLNQIANNQKGVGNVGNALGFWGLKDWAMAYAQDGYYPFYGGSHLFLADLYQTKYAKNSELFQGFTSDPTIFGASNRFQSLIHKPGHYQTVTMVASQDREVREFVPRLTLNGYANELTPFSYFVELDRQSADSRGGAPFDYNDTTDSMTVALGWMPTHELRLFSFYNKDKVKANFSSPAVTSAVFDLPTSDLSIGGSYYFSPTLVLQARAGRNKIDGGQVAESPVAGTPFSAQQSDKDHEITRDGQVGLTWRHEDRFELAVGYEASRVPEDFARTINILPVNLLFRTDKSTISENTHLAYVSGKWFFAKGAYVQADLWGTDYERHVNGEVFNALGNPQLTPVDFRIDTRETTPRLGVTFEPWANHRFRYAYQDWVRPSSAGGLGPVATAGVALDDSFLRFGGRQRRNVLRFESEWSSRYFTEVVIDTQRVTNPESIDLSLAEQFANLTRLRQRSLTDVTNFYAGVTNNSISNALFAGRVRTDQLRVASNAILSKTWSGSVSYTLTNSALALAGDDRYYLPRHNAGFGLTWVSPQRLRIAADAQWYSTALDVGATDKTAAYWTAGFSALWESVDKRTGLAIFAKDLLNPDVSAFYGIAGNLKF